MVEKLDAQQKSDLIARALQVRAKAYAPYSGHAVGAALLAASGEIYLGVNVENAAYPTGTCAERAAVFNAVTHGERSFRAVAVATRKGGSPCGACRQVLSEFGLDTVVIIVNENGDIVLETTVSGLLPEAFGPQDLKSP
jgi:cytidine deaminase